MWVSPFPLEDKIIDKVNKVGKRTIEISSMKSQLEIRMKRKK